MGNLIRGIAARRGIEIRRVPKSLLTTPDRTLRLELEALVALRLSQADDFFFIQVGAFDGAANDPLRHLVFRYNLAGVCIEPQPEAFNRLRECYRNQKQIRLLNAAVGASDGIQTLFRATPAAAHAAPWLEQLASFREDVILKHTNQLRSLKDSIERIDVRCVTLNRVLEESGRQTLDLLQIDAEGYDFEIIKTIDFLTTKPMILQYEHKHMSRGEQDQCVQLLIEHGYRVCVQHWDTLAGLSVGE